MPKYKFTSNRNDYLTPAWFYEKVLDEAGLTMFDCDVCCSEFNIPAHFRYRKDGLYLNSGNKISKNDGLKGTWFPSNWCNPPFNIADKFVYKALEEQKKGHTTYMLLPVRTETEYWFNGIYKGGKPKKDINVTFLKKGLCFVDPETGKYVQMQKKMPDGSYKTVDGVFKEGLALVVIKGNEVCLDAQN